MVLFFEFLSRRTHREAKLGWRLLRADGGPRRAGFCSDVLPIEHSAGAMIEGLFAHDLCQT